MHKRLTEKTLKAYGNVKHQADSQCSLHWMLIGIMPDGEMGR